MNRFIKSLLILFVMVTSGCGEAEQAKEPGKAWTIVDESIAAHGGWDAWTQMKGLNYSKSITLYDSAGNIESETIQIHTYRFQPNFEGKISWKSDGNQQVQYEGENAVKFINNTPQLDEQSIQEAQSTYLSSHYVLFQPWKLLDPGVNHIYSGEIQLDDSTRVDVIKLAFEGQEEGEGDTWWFYVNVDTRLLEGYLVKHDDRLSFIRNNTYDRNTRMVFPRNRSSHYVSDTTLNNKLLRAEYLYDQFELIQ